MSCYAVGDIHGCFRTFQRLLAKCRFDPAVDRLWLVGDLVNGGPDSLETLRFARDLGERAVTVLGNHDIYLLARAWGVISRKKRDTLDKLFGAPDRDDLIDWLRRRPLIHRQDGALVVHAGLLPAWTLEQAIELATAVSDRLKSDSIGEFLAASYALRRESWEGCRDPFSRLHCAFQALTLLRACKADSHMCLDFSGPPSEAPKGCRPWYSWPTSKTLGVRVYFGHWAALGFKRTQTVTALDSGCVWGNRLTAVRLEDGEVFQQKNIEKA